MPRNITNAEHDPVVERTVRFAVILREICEELKKFKGMHVTHLNIEILSNLI